MTQLAYCGLDCSACAYKAKMNCPTCQAAAGKMFWGECGLAKCCMAKGLVNCGKCDQFPCEQLKQYSFDKEHGDAGRRIENLRTAIADSAKDGAFWGALDRLVAESVIKIDRPKGSAHPRFASFYYPLDYGYLEGTSSGDANGIDVWRGSLPESKVTAVVCTLDMLKRDSEIKLLIGCTREEAREVLSTHNAGPQSAILIDRPDKA